MADGVTAETFTPAAREALKAFPIEPDALEPDSDRAIDVVNKLKDRGFLTSNAGAFRNVVKIRPPLVFAQHDADEFLTAFDATIAEIGRASCRERVLRLV